MAKNERAYERRESRFYRQEQRSRCAVCGKYYLVRHKGWACSRACAEKLQISAPAAISVALRGTLILPKNRPRPARAAGARPFFQEVVGLTSRQAPH